ncbi:uncharacterized protein LOC111868158 [Cryptotermes secundus]|uniref:uncharacterized protein LOC111868158 n=1 Tax=Cryptotermes secundus TaxID=105785 RepID=UPI001454C1D0|nr:uncharacterized protein LOC111868158 [Cryptotermes secundus]
MMVLQNHTNSENEDTHPTSHADQAVNMNAEEVSDTHEEVDPLQITFQEIKAEPEDCMNSENVLVGPYGETYPTPHDANQAMNVKPDTVSDAEEEKDSVAIPFPELKAEPEYVSM